MLILSHGTFCYLLLISLRMKILLLFLKIFSVYVQQSERFLLQYKNRSNDSLKYVNLWIFIADEFMTAFNSKNSKSCKVFDKYVPTYKRTFN
jgi:hypothetical protein